MALDKAQEYITRKRLHEFQDWGSIELDDEGKALQAELEARQTVSAFLSIILGPTTDISSEFTSAINQIFSNMFC
jgi:hypothetical protein